MNQICGGNSCFQICWHPHLIPRCLLLKLLTNYFGVIRYFSLHDFFTISSTQDPLFSLLSPLTGISPYFSLRHNMTQPDPRSNSASTGAQDPTYSILCIIFYWTEVGKISTSLSGTGNRVFFVGEIHMPLGCWVSENLLLSVFYCDRKWWAEVLARYYIGWWTPGICGWCLPVNRSSSLGISFHSIHRYVAMQATQYQNLQGIDVIEFGVPMSSKYYNLSLCEFSFWKTFKMEQISLLTKIFINLDPMGFKIYLFALKGLRYSYQSLIFWVRIHIMETEWLD